MAKPYVAGRQAAPGECQCWSSKCVVGHRHWVEDDDNKSVNWEECCRPATVKVSRVMRYDYMGHIHGTSANESMCRECAAWHVSQNDEWTTTSVVDG